MRPPGELRRGTGLGDCVCDSERCEGAGGEEEELLRAPGLRLRPRAAVRPLPPFLC